MRIIAEKLNHIYNPKTPFQKDALHDVSLTIDEGEFFGIIGHTGSGKSTFIQHLNGLLPMTSGSLHIGEFDLANKKCDFLKLRSKVGMVFQYPEYQLFSDTVENDVAFGLKNFKGKELTKEQIKADVKLAIETVGLNYEEIKDKSPYELSGGQKRRVAIAGVIVTKPEILILDEPVAGLDPIGKKELLELLHSLHKKCSKTIIIVSHDMDEIAENCTNVAVFNQGVLLAVLPPRYLFKDPEKLKEIGLDVPITIQVSSILKSRGIDTDLEAYTSEEFVNMIEKLYKDKQNA